MKSRKKSTSQDVADLAGVSQSTVSLILNENKEVTFKPETITRVFKAAEELNYKVPKRRNQPSESSELILVLTPTLANYYYIELIQAIEEYANSQGYHILVCNTFRNTKTEEYYLKNFAQNEVVGVLYTFLPSFPEMVEELNKKVPVVIIGEKYTDLNIFSVELNNISAGSLLGEHLYTLGHRHLAFISSPLDQFTLARSQRLEGIRKAFSSHGINPAQVQLIVPSNHQAMERDDVSVPYEFTLGRQLTQEFLESDAHATALIGVNDMTAFGIASYLKENNISIPGDYSICGFDNLFTSTIYYPTLTTVDYHLALRCQAAIDILIDKLEPENQQALTLPMVNKIEYMPYLLVRDSTGPAKQS